ncbi:hypothetical protein VP01_1163g4 [Puccinia sorghi]|uniref:Uncharacterized protein n=1 Tax=Puccinia sorghi TaxID=27349 RepID=A0A0L6VRG5_9BASI|nr:hypothetical protein VP01_1163g4 [Puccinia sorghi]
MVPPQQKSQLSEAISSLHLQHTWIFSIFTVTVPMENLFEVIWNPEEYNVQGQTKLLSSKDSRFMIQLVRDKPSLLLAKIRKKLYNSRELLMSLQEIHNNLVDQLSITLKKGETFNSKNFLLAKYSWVENMKHVPAESLVFTGNTSFQ